MSSPGRRASRSKSRPSWYRIRARRGGGAGAGVRCLSHRSALQEGRNRQGVPPPAWARGRGRGGVRRGWRHRSRSRRLRDSQLACGVRAVLSLQTRAAMVLLHHPQRLAADDAHTDGTPLSPALGVLLRLVEPGLTVGLGLRLLSRWGGPWGDPTPPAPPRARVGHRAEPEARVSDLVRASVMITKSAPAPYLPLTPKTVQPRDLKPPGFSL